MLTGAHAMVTGASGGIGRAMAVVLAEREVAGLFLTGRNHECLDRLADCLRRRNTPAYVQPADLTRDDEIRELAQAVHNRLEKLDILIHSAGAIINGRLSEAPVGNFDYQYQINVRAPFLLTQMLLPMLKRNQGQVVFVNSTAGLRSAPNAGQYSATKHALKAIADAFRDEINSDGVRVLSIYPGRTATQMQSAIQEAEGRPYAPELLIQPLDVAALIVNSLEMPRSVEVTDLNLRPMIKSY